MQVVTANAIESETLRLVIEWYRDRLPAKGWPSVKAFKPETMPVRALPHIGRVDVELEPFRVFYRGLGAALCDSVGREVSRMYLDELGLEQAAELTEWFRAAVKAPGPIYVRGTQSVNGHSFVYEGMSLPLGDPGTDPRAFVIGEDFLQSDSWQAVRRRRYEPWE